METVKALLLPLLTFFLVASSAIATVQEVCETAARTTPVVNYNFCVSTLSSAPGSGSATDHGLAVIAGTLAVNRATSIKSKIDSLLEKAADPKLKSSLQACDLVYANAIATWTDATAAVKRGDLMHANIWFRAAENAPSICEKGFIEQHLPSPISKENGDMLQLAGIAQSVSGHL